MLPGSPIRDATERTIKAAVGVAIIPGLFAALAGTNCAGTVSPRPGVCSVHGTIMGQTFDAADCLWSPEVYAPSSPVSGLLNIYTFGSACSKWVANAYQKGSGRIQVIFNSPRLVAHSYALINNCSATDIYCVGVFISFTDHSDTCSFAPPYPVSATGGAVVVSEVTSDGIKGTFDLMFNTDHLTGSFDAPTCGPMGALSSWSCQ
jgi:hypothetical protein